MPKRIQRKRTKGWRMPANTVYVGRTGGHSYPEGRGPWGNPYRVGMFRGYTAADAVDAYKKWLRGDTSARVWAGAPHTKSEIRNALRGKNLACWCPLDQPCHADVLLEIANRT